LEKESLVPAGTDELDLAVSVEPGTTGLQLDYSFWYGDAASSNEQYEWLNWTEPTFEGETTVTVDVQGGKPSSPIAMVAGSSTTASIGCGRSVLHGRKRERLVHHRRRMQK